MDTPSKPGYWLYEWDDETSMYDPRGTYEGDYDIAHYAMWIPNHIREVDWILAWGLHPYDNTAAVEAFIEDNGWDPALWVEIP